MEFITIKDADNQINIDNEYDYMKIFIVVPAYNESKYIGDVLDKILKYSKNIAVVDDGSTDSTYKIAHDKKIDVLHHDLNLGKGAAMKTGCEYVFNHLKADAVVFVDSDDQHDPKHLPEFFSKLRKGHDLVFGVRTFSNNMPFLKKFGNMLASILIKIAFGKYIQDIPNGYKALTKNAYKKVLWDSADYGVEMEIAARTARNKLSYGIVTIDTIYHDYDRGMTMLDVLRIFVKMIELRINI